MLVFFDPVNIAGFDVITQARSREGVINYVLTINKSDRKDKLNYQREMTMPILIPVHLILALPSLILLMMAHEKIFSPTSIKENRAVNTNQTLSSITKINENETTANFSMEVIFAISPDWQLNSMQLQELFQFSQNETVLTDLSTNSTRNTTSVIRETNQPKNQAVLYSQLSQSITSKSFVKAMAVDTFSTMKSVIQSRVEHHPLSIRADYFAIVPQGQGPIIINVREFLHNLDSSLPALLATLSDRPFKIMLPNTNQSLQHISTGALITFPEASKAVSTRVHTPPSDITEMLSLVATLIVLHTTDKFVALVNAQLNPVKTVDSALKRISNSNPEIKQLIQAKLEATPSSLISSTELPKKEILPKKHVSAEQLVADIVTIEKLIKNMPNEDALREEEFYSIRQTLEDLKINKSVPITLPSTPAIPQKQVKSQKAIDAENRAAVLTIERLIKVKTTNQTQPSVIASTVKNQPTSDTTVSTSIQSRLSEASGLLHRLENISDNLNKVTRFTTREKLDRFSTNRTHLAGLLLEIKNEADKHSHEMSREHHHLFQDEINSHIRSMQNLSQNVNRMQAKLDGLPALFRQADDCLQVAELAVKHIDKNKYYAQCDQFGEIMDRISLIGSENLTLPEKATVALLMRRMGQLDKTILQAIETIVKNVRNQVRDMTPEQQQHVMASIMNASAQNPRHAAIGIGSNNELAQGNSSAVMSQFVANAQPNGSVVVIVAQDLNGIANVTSVEFALLDDEHPEAAANLAALALHIDRIDSSTMAIHVTTPARARAITNVVTTGQLNAIDGVELQGAIHDAIQQGLPEIEAAPASGSQLIRGAVTSEPARDSSVSRVLSLAAIIAITIAVMNDKKEAYRIVSNLPKAKSSAAALNADVSSLAIEAAPENPENPVVGNPVNSIDEGSNDDSDSNAVELVHRATASAAEDDSDYGSETGSQYGYDSEEEAPLSTEALNDSSAAQHDETNPQHTVSVSSRTTEPRSGTPLAGEAMTEANKLEQDIATYFFWFETYRGELKKLDIKSMKGVTDALWLARVEFNDKKSGNLDVRFKKLMVAIATASTNAKTACENNTPLWQAYVEPVFKKLAVWVVLLGEMLGLKPPAYTDAFFKPTETQHDKLERLTGKKLTTAYTTIASRISPPDDAVVCPPVTNKQ